MLVLRLDSTKYLGRFQQSAIVSVIQWQFRFRLPRLLRLQLLSINLFKIQNFEIFK